MKGRYKFEIRETKHAPSNHPYCIRITNLESNYSNETMELSGDELDELLVALLSHRLREGRHFNEA